MSRRITVWSAAFGIALLLPAALAAQAPRTAAVRGVRLQPDQLRVRLQPDQLRVPLQPDQPGVQLPAFARPAGGQTSDTAVPELTALDYFQIQQLVARYARAIDTCSNNGYDYADLFTPDGFFAAAENGVVGTRWQGREKLAEVSGGGVRGCKNVGWIRQGVRHLYVNHIITPAPGGAVGTVDMLMIGLGGDPNRIRHEGYYEDRYVRTADGWRFASRIHHVPTRQPQADGAGGQNPSR